MPGVPTTGRRVTEKARRECWASRKRAARGGGYEYALDSLPLATRQAIAAAELREARRSDPTTVTQAAPKQCQSVATLDGWRRDEAEPRAAIYTAISALKKRSKCTWPEAVAAYNAGSISVAATIPDKLTNISMKTWENWRAKVRKKGLASLAPAYGNRKGTGVIDSQPAMRELCLGLLADYPHIRHTHVHQAIQARFKAIEGAVLPSATTVRDWIVRWKNDNKALFEAVKNPEGWRNKYMPATGDQNADVVRINQRWEMDASPADILLADGRHKLLQVVDIFTRRRMFLVSPTTTALNYGSLLRRALLTWGVPETLLTDNGAAESGKHMTRLMDELEIELRLTGKFASWEKGSVERGFRTFQHDLLELKPGYCGHNVAERSEIQSRAEYSDRLTDKDAAITISMTADELQQFADDWCDHRYHHRAQKKLGDRSPLEVLAAHRHGIRTVDEHALDLLLMPAAGNDGWRVASKEGLRVDHIVYAAAELMPGNRYHVLLDQDISRVKVRQLNAAGDFEFVCWAVDPSLEGIDRAEIAARRKRHVADQTQTAKREMKAFKRLHNTGSIAADILADNMAANGKVAFFPQAETPHSSAGLDAASAALQARAPATTTLTPDEQAAHQRLIAEMTRPKAEVVELPEDERARYRRWHALHQRTQRGEPLTAQETRWHASYQRSAEYRAQHLIFSDFPDLLEQGAQQ